jgi:Flp pilus assembly protein TadD
MFASKKLGLTFVIGSLLAACASSPKPTSNEVVVPTVTGAESSELDLEKLAKERAAQGLTAKKDESKEKNTVAADSSKEPEMGAISAELKALAAPVLADYQKAIVLMKANQADEAFALFEEVHNKAAQFSGPLINQAIIRIQQQKYKEADDLLKKAITLNEKNPFVYNLQGYVGRQLGLFPYARTAYEKAISLSPKYAKAHFNLGVLADLYLQDFPLALQHYEAYQTTQATPDATVGKWIIDLQKRTGVYKAPAKPAKVEEIIVEETPAPVEAVPATAPEPIPPSVNTLTPEVAPTTATVETPTVNVEATPLPPTDAKNSKEKAKKSAKSKKQGKNVALDTATPVVEPVKSSPSENTPSSASEPIPTTAAGVQP